MSSATPSAARNPVIVFALIALLCVIWGSTWLVIKAGLRDLPPFTSATARFSLAAITMAVVAPRLARAEGGAKPDLRLVLATGFGQFSISYGIVYWSEQTLPSGLVSVLWAVYPLFLAGLSWLLLREERLALRQWLGISLGFAGIVTLFSTDVYAIGPDAVPTGLVLLGSPLLCSLSTIYVKRHGRGTSSLLLNRDGMTVGAVGLGIVALATEREAEIEWTTSACLSVVYLGLIGTCLAFGVYLWLLRWVAAYKLSLIAYISPMLALLLGAVVGEEDVGRDTILGSACILTGVCIAGFARRRGVRVTTADEAVG